MYIMETKGITIDELYNLIKQRFDLNDKRFELIDRRLENLERMVQEIYNTRDKLSFQFNRRVLFGTGLFAGIVAFVVSIFTGRYVSP